MVKKHALVIDDEAEIAMLLASELQGFGYEVLTANSAEAAEPLFGRHKPAVVFCDIHMPGRSGLAFLEEVRRRNLCDAPWVFITGNGDPDLVERACRLGALDVLLKPFEAKELEAVVARVERRRDQAVFEIIDTVHAISGIVLGPEKAALVETRLMRRARFLGMPAVAEYYQYFRAHRETEVREIVSLITTHTTDFFREADHFDVLVSRVLPPLLARGKPIRVWSAACSTGEEAYSLAIAYLELLAERGLAPESAPALEIIGTDIDFRSVERARRGIYAEDRVRGVAKPLLRQYFDAGTGELAGLYRVKDAVHRLCKFEQGNLLSERLPVSAADVVFLRNVLIYFKPDDVRQIIARVERHMHESGVLFLGHSETAPRDHTSLAVIGNSVYQRRDAAGHAPLARGPQGLAPVAAPARSATALASGRAATATAGRVGVPPATSVGGAPVRVFIIDDSRTVRHLLRRILGAAHGFEVVGEAENPIAARALIPAARPDVVTLDIHMPEMDGISYLKTIKGKAHPPVVMVSTVAYEDASEALKCFELGAVEYLEKPAGLDLESEGERFREVIRAAATAPRRRDAAPPRVVDEPAAAAPTDRALLVIGASTGGIEALTEVLVALPAETPPILIVQHIPAGFSRAFAQRLDEKCRVRVAEAQDGVELRPSHVYIAPGGRHLEVVERGGRLFTKLSDEAPVNRHKPSVDVLFASAAKLPARVSGAAVILTGMGADGAAGLGLLKDRGWATAAQDEATCVVFGMPKAAIERGAAARVLPLGGVARFLVGAGGRVKAA